MNDQRFIAYIRPSTAGASTPTLAILKVRDALAEADAAVRLQADSFRAYLKRTQEAVAKVSKPSLPDRGQVSSTLVYDPPARAFPRFKGPDGYLPPKRVNRANPNTGVIDRGRFAEASALDGIFPPSPIAVAYRWHNAPGTPYPTSKLMAFIHRIRGRWVEVAKYNRWSARSAAHSPAFESLGSPV